MDRDNSRRSNSKKRTHSSSDDGKRKRFNSRHDDMSMSSEPIETIYRILCPVQKIGSVLGRDERVIIIFNYQNQSEPADEAAENISSDGLGNMKPHCSAQDALLKIHDKIVADEVHDGVANKMSESADDVTARILVQGNQVGCLLGKGGSIIQQLRSDTGAGIHVLPSENLPQCALKSDELVQITGAPSLVRKALYEISTRLHQHPRKENLPLEEIIDASTQRKRESPPPLPHGNPMLPHLHIDHSLPIPLLDPYRDGPLLSVAETEEFSVRILCASELIGSVIGKSGANVKRVEQQTGARIKVQEVDKDASGERLIIVSSKEIPADPVSPTIEALMLLYDKVSAPSEKRHVSTRLVVPSSKVGCILGEGGKIITEMRRRTGAEIRVYSKSDKPKYLSFDDELVQVAGAPAIARGALTEIASRLRTRTLRDTSSAINPLPIAPFHGPVDLPSREFTLYGRSANDPPYGRPAIGPPSGRLTNDPYGRPAIDPPFGRLTNDSPYGRPAIVPPFGRPTNDPPYGRPTNNAPYGRPSSNVPYGRLNESASHDPSHSYPVDYFSKREYPSGSPPFVSNAPSSAYERYAASARIPTRELPSSFSPSADYMSHRSYRGHAPTDSYSSRGTQQLGITRDGNSNAYDYTEAARQMQGRGDHRGQTNVAGMYSSTIELKIPNSSLESIIGVGGVNLAEIRQISGAKLRLLEAHAGSSESVVEIQGTLDQAKAAQSLLQGFISANNRSTQQQPQPSRMPLYPSWG
ncbi:unnamed protein product [Urochloa humidicola]